MDGDQLKRPLRGRLGERPVGRDQPDPGTAVQQVVDVRGALVGDAEDQLRQRRGQVRCDRREQLVVASDP